ncbi:hypothetical protein CHLRE_02g120250v5 [Chlamydomonas reinhardtii]|uniref:non-specific serine/threonine protein kinase n=1 Tax=Chlamydomonas reinhardtii TaxID=3055 RepID=A0A2K3E3K7_CHLRE|nr:uncharacterized protein CHLRE_02g120250v5 [Chlamydomonas reinhardtii]PNW87375.1 hypothetical protein CHLRE_02g120250v5 [Chlamydomonas reinhardtii]
MALAQRQVSCRIERSTGASTSQPVGSCLLVQRRPGQRRGVPARATPEFIDALSALVPNLPLEQIAAPCQVMKCGDIVYRSTLDPSLYNEAGFDEKTVALLAPVLAYLFLPPGVLPGAIDYYIRAPLKRKQTKAIDKNDIVLGKRLGTGGFGTVFKGELKEEGGVKTSIIIKKAKEFGEAEVWMNERMSRVAGHHVAEFVTAFDESLNVPLPAAAGKRAAPVQPTSPLDANSIWLVWVYEGDNTLSSLMERREWPYNLEPLLFGRELRAPRGPVRELVTIKEAFRQLVQAVAACHSVGIVHRDIKPANCIVSERDKKIKLIDLGAAADLRIGINYVPNEYLLDPRYAPPQQYIMSTQTPKPPPKPVAAFLSPILWTMEKPDRFDMYSCGITLLQMVFGHLRNDNALIAFNKRLQELKWDLPAWRREEEAKLPSAKGALAESLEAGFEALDADGGAGWDLLMRLLAYKPTDRPSAAAVLAHPWLTSAPGRTASLQHSLSGSFEATVSTAAAATSTALTAAGKSLGQAAKDAGLASMEEAILKVNQGALTEAQLMEELGLQEPAPVAPREGSQTIAWWQERQNELKARLVERREAMSESVGSAINNARGGKGAKPTTPVKPTGPMAAAGAAAAAAAAAARVEAKVKVPNILGVKKPASGGGSNGRANGNGNGKAAPAKAANGNGSGNGNTNGNGNGAKQQLFGGLLGRKQQPVEEVQEEPEEEVEPEQETASKKERAFNLLGVFRR